MTRQVGAHRVRSDHWPWTRWTSHFWIPELLAIAAVPCIVLLLQYSEEGMMRRHAARVPAAVDELPMGHGSCGRCPLVFELDGERHRVAETLATGEEPQFFAGNTVWIYVDRDDTNHVIAAPSIRGNLVLGWLGIIAASLFALAWPVKELTRPLVPRATDGEEVRRPAAPGSSR
jgi:hypothetical protein